MGVCLGLSLEVWGGLAVCWYKKLSCSKLLVGEGRIGLPLLLVGEGGWGDEGFNDSSVHLSESSVHLSESSVHLSESSVHLSESSVHLSESSVHLSESSVHLSESSVHLSESSVQVSEPSGETSILYLWATFQEAMPTLIVGKSLWLTRLYGQDAQATLARARRPCYALWAGMPKPHLHGRDARATSAHSPLPTPPIRHSERSEESQTLPLRFAQGQGDEGGGSG